MARYITEEYSSVGVWLCPAEYTPSAMCYPDKCVSSYIKTSVVQDVPPVSGWLSIGFETISVTAYLVEEDGGEYIVNLFLLPKDKTEKEFTPPCADYTDENTHSGWERNGDRITASLPEIRTCGVTALLTYYSSTGFSETAINPTGEITSSFPEYSHNIDGRIPLSTSLTGTLLVPGKTVSVYFRMYDLPEEYFLGSYNFQTDIFTGAKLLGCGVVVRRKVYKDKNDTDKGYTYEYVPIQGGINSTLKDEWLFSKNLRWCVEYYGERYWLRSAYPCRLPAGSFVAVAKGMNLPRIPDTAISNLNTKRTLSESADMIVPEIFYQGTI
jgi:hypothetical protein